MVIQKEARSRRVEEDIEEGVLGAPGYANPVMPHDASIPRPPGRHTDADEGVPVPVQRVAFVVAEVEEPGTEDGVDQLDVIDDDDDDDIGIDEGYFDPVPEP